MLKHFELIPFLIGFFIGIFGLIFWKQHPNVILKYPHPSSVDNLVYKDANDVCYRYSSKEVNCDKNEGNLVEYPLQEKPTNDSFYN